MGNKALEPFKIPVGFFVLGVMFLIIGAYGEQVAIKVSRPSNASSWTTSESLINAFMLVPMIIGVVFFLLFICTFSISFYNLELYLLNGSIPFE